ncbi:hypothetical protein U9M48_026651 [Paspalum notatum var. saurae]|uniref:Uncharacterized protein n=1 Tax=Paspalum notatum var. saurae TaxID=547442 RepID=A0AAQ3TT48_PASNO
MVATHKREAAAASESGAPPREPRFVLDSSVLSVAAKPQAARSRVLCSPRPMNRWSFRGES